MDCRPLSGPRGYFTRQRDTKSLPEYVNALGLTAHLTGKTINEISGGTSRIHLVMSLDDCHGESKSRGVHSHDASIERYQRLC